MSGVEPDLSRYARGVALAVANIKPVKINVEADTSRLAVRMAQMAQMAQQRSGATEATRTLSRLAMAQQRSGATEATRTLSRLAMAQQGQAKLTLTELDFASNHSPSVRNPS